MLSPKNMSKQIQSKKCCPQINCGKKILVQKDFFPKQGQRKFWSKERSDQKQLGYVLTMTSVTWTKVDGTNIPKTLANSYRWPNNPIFKFWLRTDQQQLRYVCCYRDPTSKNMTFSKSEVKNIAASSRNLIWLVWLASWGPQSK